MHFFVSRVNTVWNLLSSEGCAVDEGRIHAPSFHFLSTDVISVICFLSSIYGVFNIGLSGAAIVMFSLSLHILFLMIMTPLLLILGHLTARSDVYSFGVVLLEMLSGRRAVDKNRPSGEHNLVEWAKPYLANKRKIFRILDNRLEGQYSLEGAHKASNLALRCLSTEAKFRPTMTEVVTALEQLQDCKEPEITSNPSGGMKHRRRSADDVRNEKPPIATPYPLSADDARKEKPVIPSAHPQSADYAKKEKPTTAIAYPRPSVSPLYT